MTTAIENLDLKHDVVQLLVREAVRAGLDSPLRDPILEAVASTTGERVEATSKSKAAEREGQHGIDSSEEQTADNASETVEKNRTTKAGQGLAVFVVLFVVLYVVLRQLTGDESD